MSIRELYEDIQSQPAALINHLDRFKSFIETTKRLRIKENFVLTGLATSYYAWEAANLYMRKRGESKGSLIDTSDLLDYDIPLHQDERPIFVLSRSGESAEIIRLVDTISKDRLLIAISENPDSPLAKRADQFFEFQADEKTYPNTKSFTLSLACAFSVAIGLGCHYALTADEWVFQAARSMESMLFEWDNAKEIAGMIAGKDSLIIDGQGYLSGVTKQAALDFQEIRIPAIPVTSGIIRHGTIELTVRPDISILVLVPDDKTASKRIQLVNELYDQKTSVAVIAAESVRVERPVPLIRVPDIKEELQPFLYALAMQQIHACAAQSKKIEVIQPALVEKVTRKE